MALISLVEFWGLVALRPQRVLKCDLVRFKEWCKTEVSQLYADIVVSVSRIESLHEDVFKFNVSVCDAFWVQVRQCWKKLPNYTLGHDLNLPYGSLNPVMVEVEESATCHKFHYEVVLKLILINLYHLSQVFMLTNWSWSCFLQVFHDFQLVLKQLCKFISFLRILDGW